jgi:hypothetical protein
MIQNIESSIYHKGKKRFYLMNVWLFMPFPTLLFSSSTLRGNEIIWRYGTIALYFILSMIISVAITKLYRVQRS